MSFFQSLSSIKYLLFLEPYLPSLSIFLLFEIIFVLYVIYCMHDVVAAIFLTICSRNPSI